MDSLNDSVNLVEKGAVNLILIAKLGIAFKLTNLRKRSKLPGLWVICKKEHGGVGQVSVIHQMQFFHQDFFRLIQCALFDAPLFSGPFFKAIYDIIIHIFEGKGRKRKIVPGRSLFAQ